MLVDSLFVSLLTTASSIILKPPSSNSVINLLNLMRTVNLTDIAEADVPALSSAYRSLEMDLNRTIDTRVGFRGDITMEAPVDFANVTGVDFASYLIGLADTSPSQLTTLPADNAIVIDRMFVSYRSLWAQLGDFVKNVFSDTPSHSPLALRTLLQIVCYTTYLSLLSSRWSPLSII
jgi:hypothetical protein